MLVASRPFRHFSDSTLTLFSGDEIPWFISLLIGAVSLVLPFIGAEFVWPGSQLGRGGKLDDPVRCCCSGQSCTSRTATATDLPLPAAVPFALAGFSTSIVSAEGNVGETQQFEKKSSRLILPFAF